MSICRFFILFFLTIPLFFCGGNGVDDSLKVKNRTEKVPLSDIKNTQSTGNILKITGVAFSKLVDIENDLIATPVLSDKEAEKEFYFRWFVNDREVTGENTATLSREFFNENDWVYCRVRISGEREEFPEFSSSMVKIMGPLPIVNLDPIENFNPPGIFTYKINARMPETEDIEPEYDDEEEIDPERSIKYELISPLEKGIELNTLTGEITWNLTEELIAELGNKITIKFSIISPSGRKVNSSISLSLQGDKDKENNSDNNSTMGSEIE